MKDNIDLLNEVDKEGELSKTCLQDAINIIDHLMLILTFISALCISNLINITLKEAQSAKQRDELDAKVFKNAKYKTSLIYGTKITWVPMLTYCQVQLYIKYLRLMLILDSLRALRDRPLF